MKTSRPRSKCDLPGVEALGLFEQAPLDLLLRGVADEAGQALGLAGSLLEVA
jgi:hypothetical protein